MNILVTGKTGQLGWELQRCLAPLGRVLVTDRHSLDLANPDAIRATIRNFRPEIIVNAAAYTAVNAAEEEAAIARAINGNAPAIMAEEAKRLEAALIHFSTDYVFDGVKNAPYLEEDPTNPLNVYGATKLAGEHAIRAVGGKYLILRTGWVYAPRGRNFFLTMLRLGREGKPIVVVNDQIGSPTWSRMIAEATAQILGQCCPPTSKTVPWQCGSSVYHLTAAAQTSWYEFAKTIFEEYSQRIRPHQGERNWAEIVAAQIKAIQTPQYPSPARRPAYSVLSNSKIYRDFGMRLPHWREQLAWVIDELSTTCPEACSTVAPEPQG